MLPFDIDKILNNNAKPAETHKAKSDTERKANVLIENAPIASQPICNDIADDEELGRVDEETSIYNILKPSSEHEKAIIAYLKSAL